MSLEGYVCVGERVCVYVSQLSRCVCLLCLCLSKCVLVCLGDFGVCVWLSKCWCLSNCVFVSEF